MNRLALLILPLAFLFTGCFEILEELYLQKGGKGSYLYSIDMSAMMDESMKEFLQSAGEEGENSLAGVELDSTVYFRDTHAEEIKSLDKPEIFERAFMKMEISDANDRMVIRFGLDFEKIDDIAYFLQNLDQVTGDAMEGGMSMGAGLLPGAKSAEMFALKGKKLSRVSGLEMAEEASEEDMGMLSLFMESATFRTVYHLPGSVKKTTIPGAVIEGNTVTVESSFTDLMKGESNTDGYIKFK